MGEYRGPFGRVKCDGGRGEGRVTEAPETITLRKSEFSNAQDQAKATDKAALSLSLFLTLNLSLWRPQRGFMGLNVPSKKRFSHLLYKRSGSLTGIGLKI